MSDTETKTTKTDEKRDQDVDLVAGILAGLEQFPGQHGDPGTRQAAELIIDALANAK